MPNANDIRKKKIADNTTFWERNSPSMLLSGKDQEQRDVAQEQMANDNIKAKEQAAKIEAIRQRRMKEQAAK